MKAFFLDKEKENPKTLINRLGLVAQSVVSLIADPGVVSLIPAWPHTFVEIDLEHSPPFADSR